MKKIISVVVMLIVTLTLVACSTVSPYVPAVPEGQVWTLSAGSTIWTIKQALSGAHDTMILQNGQSYIFMKVFQNSGWGAAMITEAKDAAGEFYHVVGSKGNLISAKDAAGFVQALLDKGWQVINPDQVSSTTRVALKDLSVGGALATAMRTLMAGFFICPVENLPIPAEMEVMERIET